MLSISEEYLNNIESNLLQCYEILNKKNKGHLSQKFLLKFLNKHFKANHSEI